MPLHSKTKQIADLTLHEIDMIYSLARTGEWPYSEIGRVYRLSKDDVGTVFKNYEELREMVAENQLNQRLSEDPSPELTTNKRRKRRSDARYATSAERQRAFRDRLKGKRNAEVHVPSPDPTTDLPAPIQGELSIDTVDAS